MILRPIGEHLVVKKDRQPPLKVGGILIPESAERTPRYAPTIMAIVRAVGGEVKQVKPGDRVALKIYAGDEWYVRAEQITHCRERDIVGRMVNGRIVPFGDRVLLKRIHVVEEIKDGIIIPEVAREKETEATVIAVGPDCTDIKAGAHVLLAAHGGTQVKIADEEYVLVREPDILGSFS